MLRDLDLRRCLGRGFAKLKVNKGVDVHDLLAMRE